MFRILFTQKKLKGIMNLISEGKVGSRWRYIMEVVKL